MQALIAKNECKSACAIAHVKRIHEMISAIDTAPESKSQGCAQITAIHAELSKFEDEHLQPVIDMDRMNEVERAMALVHNGSLDGLGRTFDLLIAGINMIAIAIDAPMYTRAESLDEERASEVDKYCESLYIHSTHANGMATCHEGCVCDACVPT
jgi:hypothetical protein